MSCRTTCRLAFAAELEVVADVLDGLGVVLALLEEQLLLGDVVAAQDGLDLLERFGGESLQVAHLAERVLDQVLHRLFQAALGVVRLELERLPGDEVFGSGEHFAEQCASRSRRWRLSSAQSRRMRSVDSDSVPSFLRDRYFSVWR